MPARRLLLLLTLACALPVQAQIYQWLDADGQQHFSTHPPVAEQGLKPLKLHYGYKSDGPPPPPPTSSTATPAAMAADGRQPEKGASEHEMCSEAVRWTHKEDLPNLREIAAERLRQGKIKREEHKKAMKGLDAARDHITLGNCLTSKGKDREVFECLSQGSGLAICTGAMAEALDRATREVQQRQGR